MSRSSEVDGRGLLGKYLEWYFSTMNDPRFKEQARRALESNLEANLELLKSLEGLALEMVTRRDLPPEEVLRSSVKAQMFMGWDYFEKLTRLNAEFANNLLTAIRTDLHKDKPERTRKGSVQKGSP